MVVFTDLGRMVSIFFLCFLLIGYVHGSALMFMISFFCLTIILVSAFLAWYALRGVECRRKLPSTTTFSGDPIDAAIELHEQSPRWRLFEIYDRYTNLITDHTTHRRMTAFVMGGKHDVASVSGVHHTLKRMTHQRIACLPDTMRFSRRGHYRLGPLTLYSYDPFGLVYIQRTMPQQDDLIVYPHPLPLPELVLNGMGGRQSSEFGCAARVGETADFHGIRPYVQGDDLRRVHWKSTAHTGKLAMKEFRYHSSGALQLIIDLQHGVHFGKQEHATLEAAVTIGASMLNFVLGSGNRAGLLTTGEEVTALIPESGRRQLHRTLETLALAKDNGRVALAQALTSCENMCPSHCTTVVITPSTDKAIIGPLLELRAHSAAVLLILLNPRSFYEMSETIDEHVETDKKIKRHAKRLRKKLSPSHRQSTPPTEEAHRDLLHAATAAGIEVFPVGAELPLHEALQGIRTRF